MNFNEYRPLALRTAKMFPTMRENLRHAALGLITELGEFTTEVKRHVIYGKPLNNEMLVHMREELGDAYWYVPLAFFALGADPIAVVPNQKNQLEALNDIGDFTLLLATVAMTIGASVATASIEEDRKVMIDMLSILIVALDRACGLLGFNPDEVRAENIAKLRARFPDKYSDEAAEARADKNGLPASAS